MRFPKEPRDDDPRPPTSVGFEASGHGPLWVLAVTLRYSMSKEWLEDIVNYPCGNYS